MSAALEGVILRSHGSRLLGTLFVPAATSRSPAALLLHGIPGVEKNYDLAYALRDAGWVVLAIHYRGSWGSEGAYSLSGILDDITAGVDYLCQHPRVDVDRLAGVGLSLGGWGVVAAAARDERLRALVSMNPLVDPRIKPLPADMAAEFASMLNGISPAEVQSQWADLTPLPALETHEQGSLAARLAGRPTLLLTGDADPVFDPAHARLLAEALPREGAEWKRLPEANHTFDAHRALVVRTVTDWLVRAFSPLPPLPAGLTLRAPQEADHARVMGVMVEWWGGRDVRGLLPRLFFQHFHDTSFVVEREGALVAFLIGFISQSEPGAGYIHFVGVRPDHRRLGLGRALYARFFEKARARGAREVRCVTATHNQASLKFHSRLGFSVSDAVASYDGPGEDRFFFWRPIA